MMDCNLSSRFRAVFWCVLPEKAKCLGLRRLKAISGSVVLFFLPVACLVAGAGSPLEVKAQEGGIRTTTAQDFKIQQALHRLLAGRAAAQLGVAVYNLDKGEKVFSFNEKQALQPASVLKILTSVAALKELGAEYTFKTKVYAQSLQGGFADVLWIKGGGDPSLCIETAWAMVRRLKKMGLKEIGKLGLDGSLFAEQNPGQGQRAYQTGSAALAFNYNSLAFDICPAVPGRSALVSPDPWEFKVDIQGSIVTEGGRGRRPNINRKVNVGRPAFVLSGAVQSSDPCITIYRGIEQPEIMFGETFLQFLKYIGIPVKGALVSGVVPPGATLLFEQASQPLSRTIQDLNHFSNNFIAEQILFALGESADGRWRRSEGLKRLARFLTSLGVPAGEFELHDGSGLSRANRISAQALVRVLEYAAHDPLLGAEFESSLSLAGRSGTLKKRDFGLSEEVLRGKTGTLDKVSSLAGYLVTADHSNFAFSILQNEVVSREQALAFEDSIVAALIGR